MIAGDYQGAVEGFTKVLQLDPKNIDGYVNRGIAQLQLRHPNEALSDVNTALQLAPAANKNARSVLLTARGKCYFNAQRLAEAYRDFTEAIQLNTKNEDAYLQRGTLRVFLKDYTNAVADVTQAIHLDNRSAQSYFVRGNANRYLEKIKDAEKDYTEAIRLNPQYIDCYVNRGTVRADMKDFKGAIEDLSHALRLDPKFLLGYSNRAVLKFNSGDYRGAVEDHSVVLSMDSNYTPSYLNRAMAWQSLKDYNRAVADYNEVLKRNPQDIQGFLNNTSAVSARMNEQNYTSVSTYALRGQTRIMTGDTVGACEDFQKALTLGNNAIYNLISKYCNAPTTLLVSGSAFPRSLQFYPRDAQDSATMLIEGTINSPAVVYDSVYVDIQKNNVAYKRLAATLSSKDGKAAFSFQPKIHAELSNYSLRLGVKNATKDTVLAVRDSIVCGDALLVSGQSNIMLGETWNAPERRFLRTFNWGIGDNMWAMANAGNEDKIGGVGAVGLQIGSSIASQYKIPVCIINGGMGASTIEQHLRIKQRPFDPFTLYGRTLLRTREAGVLSSIKALVWYQGESDAVPNYFERFIDLHRGWKEDYSALKKIYLVQIRPSDCGQQDQDSLRDMQRGLGGFSKVEVCASVAVPGHDGCHYSPEGYKALGTQIFRLMARDFYGSSDTAGIGSPNLKKASFVTKERREIVLDFATSTTTTLIVPHDTVGGVVNTPIKEYFFVDGKSGIVENVVAVGNKVRLTLKQPMDGNLHKLSYLPNMYYNGMTVVYEGPWLTTQRGVGVLTFKSVTIDNP